MGRYVSQKRILIRYGDEGGDQKDGIIEIRRGLSDINIGDRKYSMVRIPIDSHWYIQGMAMYSNDVPIGYDIVFYTRKPKGTPLKTNDISKVNKCVYKYHPDGLPFIQMVNFEIIDRNNIESDIPKQILKLEEVAPHIPPILPQKKEEKGAYTVKVSYPTSDDYKIQIGPGEIQITGTKPFDVFCIQSQQKQEL